MGVENGFIPPVEIPKGTRNTVFLSRWRSLNDDPRRGSWDLYQLASMGLVVSGEFQDVTRVEILPTDGKSWNLICKHFRLRKAGNQPSEVDTQAITTEVGVVLVPIDDIPIQPYRIRVCERLTEPRRRKPEDSFIKI